jgi:hypothetical protein
VPELGALGPIPPGRADGPLLLADIGGHTAFLRAVATAHVPVVGSVALIARCEHYPPMGTPVFPLRTT